MRISVKDFFSALAEGAQLNVEYRLRCKDGSPVWCSLSGKAVDTNVPVDLTKGVLWVVDNISARKAEEMRLRRLATTDDLTGALTRKEFFRQVKATMERLSRNPAGYSLLMVDLDHFKSVNDQYGHEAGDTVLQSFVFECRKVLREADLLARIGGEEFALFLPETDLGGAIRVAERLRKRIAASVIPTRGGALSYTVSIGVSWNNTRDVSIAECCAGQTKACTKPRMKAGTGSLFMIDSFHESPFLVCMGCLLFDFRQ